MVVELVQGELEKQRLVVMYSYGYLAKVDKLDVAGGCKAKSANFVLPELRPPCRNWLLSNEALRFLNWDGTRCVRADLERRGYVELCENVKCHENRKSVTGWESIRLNAISKGGEISMPRKLSAWGGSNSSTLLQPPYQGRTFSNRLKSPLPLSFARCSIYSHSARGSASCNLPVRYIYDPPTCGVCRSNVRCKNCSRLQYVVQALCILCDRIELSARACHRARAG